MVRFRRFLPVNANGMCEAFNKHIKAKLGRAGSIYTRLDKVVVHLQTFVSRRLEEVDSVTFQSNTFRFKQIVKANMDSRSSSLDVSSVLANSWPVQVEGRESSVTRVADHIYCEMICRACAACKHMFVCDCTSMPHGTYGFCKHIHAVCMFLSGSSASVVEVEPTPVANAPSEPVVVVNNSHSLEFAQRLRTVSLFDAQNAERRAVTLETVNSLIASIESDSQS